MKLSLESNNIESIEPISHLFCPKIVELQLGNVDTIQATTKSPASCPSGRPISKISRC